MTSIPESCLRCDNYEHDNHRCSVHPEIAFFKSNPDLAMACDFSWGTPIVPYPHLTIIFRRGIAAENIKEVAQTLAKTAVNKFHCLDLTAAAEESHESGHA